MKFARSFFIHLFVVASIIQGFAGGAQARPEPACAEKLQLTELSSNEWKEVLKRFKSRQLVRLPNNTGFSLLQRPGNGMPVKTVFVPNLSDDFKPKLAWELNGQRYDFLDVGLKNLEGFSTRVNTKIIENLLDFPDQDIYIRYSTLYGKLLTNSLTNRWAAQDAVLDVYHLVKPYLRPIDFQVLRRTSRVSDNNDVLVVLASDENDNPNAEPSREDIINRVVLTLQISYYGNRTFLSPSPFNSDLALSPDPLKTDFFPFEYRIPKESRKAFREKFAAKFPLPETCEMLRYLSLDAPPALRDRFLTFAFSRAINRHQKFIVASADKFTARLYRQYGFEIFSRLPTAQNEAEEYLVYADLTSQKFSEAFYRLIGTGAGVQILKVARR